MNGFLEVVERRATGRLLVVLLIIFAAVMLSVHALDVPWSLVRLKRMTGGVSILDMQFHYTAQGARDLLTGLGPDGRSFYLWRILGGLDVLLPALFATVTTVAMAVSFRGVVGGRSAWRIAQWLPFVAMTLDYAENVLIAKLLLSFPIDQPALAAAAGWTTTAKNIAYLVSLIACLAPVVVRFSRRAGVSATALA